MIVDHKMPSNEIHFTVDFKNVKQVKENFEKLIKEYKEKSQTITELHDEVRNLRLELHTLRFKESQEHRFIWWIWNVYSKNVMDTVAAITHACTYQDEATAASGKYGLPIKCFEMMRRLTESSHGICDGTYLDVEISTVVKTQTDNDKCWWTQESDPEVFPNLWRAGCGNSFYLDADKPSDNYMKYCCYCGKEIAEGE